MVRAAKPHAAEAQSLSASEVGEALATAALKATAAAALGERVELDDLVEMLRVEYRDVRGWGKMEPRELNSIINFRITQLVARAPARP
jgi:hypothetical protein